MEKFESKEASQYFSDLHDELDRRTMLRKDPFIIELRPANGKIPNTKEVRHAQAMEWLRKQSGLAHDYFERGNVNNPLP